jgi:hypothetical protein
MISGIGVGAKKYAMDGAHSPMISGIGSRKKMRHSWHPFAHDIRDWRQGKKCAIHGAHSPMISGIGSRAKKCAIHGVYFAPTRL